MDGDFGEMLSIEVFRLKKRLEDGEIGFSWKRSGELMCIYI
jgi:hypothetical protein